MTEKTYNKLTVNPGTKDRFRLVLRRIPPSILLPDYMNKWTENENRRLFSVSARTCQLPGITQNEQRHATPVGEATDWERDIDFSTPLDVEYSVGDDWYMYNVFLLWMYLKSHPEMIGGMADALDKEKILTEAFLIVLDNNLEKAVEFKFVDVHPTNLGEISFDFSDNDSIYHSVEFAYSYFVPSDKYEVEVPD